MCKVKMFAAWLRMDTSPSYKKLASALAAVGKRNIAEAMCTARGTKATILECRVCYSACRCNDYRTNSYCENSCEYCMLKC